MRKIIAEFLALSLCLSVLPIASFASESVEFATICIDQERPQQYTVIRSGDELLFSGEDLASLGGYSYHIEDNDAYFIRGEKTLRVDLDENYLYPFDQETFKPYSNKVALQHGVQEVQGIYFFPGSQLLPWLSVTCAQVEGTLKVVRDEVSVWELTNTFQPETYAFDFLSCCKELGINDKWTKALSYVQDKGLSMILDIMPVNGTTAGAYNDYYALLEGILQDKTCTEYAAKELTGGAGKINKWLDVIESLADESQLPDELQVFSSVIKALDSVPVKYTADLALYLSTFALDNEDKLNAIKYLVIMQPEHHFPEAMSRAAENIVLEYSDVVLGVLGKSIDTLLDEVLGMIGDNADGAYKAALKLIGFPGMVASDSASGINKIDKYSMLADCCLRAYNQENDGHVSVMDIQELRSYAFLYLYSCEQNWSAMEKFAREKEKYELADKYAQKARQAEIMASQFLSSAFSQTNDSDEYGNNNLRMKREYSKLLLNAFSEISYSSTKEQLPTKRYDSSFVGEWVNGYISDNIWDRTLTINSIEGNHINFDIEFYRIMGYENQTATINSDGSITFIAADEYSSIAGSLELNESITMHINESTFEYIEPETIVFARRDAQTDATLALPKLVGNWYYYEETETGGPPLISYLYFYEDGTAHLGVGYYSTDVGSGFNGNWTPVATTEDGYVVRLEGTAGYYSLGTENEDQAFSADAHISVSGKLLLIEGMDVETTFWSDGKWHERDLDYSTWADGSSSNANLVYATDSYLYYCVETNSGYSNLVCLDLFSGKTVLVDENVLDNQIQIDNGYMYYTKSLELYAQSFRRVKVGTMPLPEDVEAVNSGVVIDGSEIIHSSAHVSNGEFYNYSWFNSNAYCSIYKYSSSENATIICDRIFPPANLSVYNGRLYFDGVNLSEDGIYTVSTDGGQYEELYRGSARILCIDDEYIYFSTGKNSEGIIDICNIPIQGGEAVQLVAGHAEYVTAYDGWVYFIDTDDSNKIKRVNSATRKIQTLANTECSDFVIDQKNRILYYLCDNSVSQVCLSLQRFLIV